MLQTRKKQRRKMRRRRLERGFASRNYGTPEYYLALLKDCANNKDLKEGNCLHLDILQKGLLDKSPYLGRALISMYARCGNMEKATEILEKLCVRDVVSWSILITSYTHQRKFRESLLCFERMRNEGIFPDPIAFTCILKACGRIQDINKGKKIHNEIIRNGVLGKDDVLDNALVDMYARCGSSVKAHQLVNELVVRDVVSWNALISGYAQQGHCEDALICFRRMYIEVISHDAITFTCALKACGNIVSVHKGKEIHTEVVSRGLLMKDIVLGNALVDMYAKCGQLREARAVFHEIPVHDVISWNALISGYVQKGQGEDAWNCFECMQIGGTSPDSITFTCMLKACGCIGALDKGKQIHDEIIRNGLLQKDTVLGNCLVEMYAKCGALAKAQEVFNQLPIQNVSSWNSLIVGFSQHGQVKDAFNYFEMMQYDAQSPDVNTFVHILKACGNIGAVDKGKQIHHEIVNQGLLEKHTVLGNAVIDMYAKCGRLAEARHVLYELPIRDVGSWSMMMAGYIQQSQFVDVLDCLEQMRSDKKFPNTIIFLYVLKACGNIRAVSKGEQIHEEIVNKGWLEKSIALGNALVDMYSKCGVMAKAQHVFDELPVRDEVTWNALIGGFAQNGQVKAAFKSFEEMKGDGFHPNVVTFTCLLKACGNMGVIDKGEQIHDEIVNQGLLEKYFLLGNVLVDMYAKCGMLPKAKQVLNELLIRDEASWNSLITGYTLQGHGEEALICFEKMQNDGLFPNAITFTSILKACGSIKALNKGRKIHEEIVNKGLLGKDAILGNALVDMYGKCGDLLKAQEVFDGLLVRDAISWNALIAGYSQHGYGEDALNRFQIMQNNGVTPDSVTISCILKACGSIEALDKGRQIHNEILSKGWLTKDVVIGNSLVDMYVKCGALSKAQQVCDELPIRDIVAWNALITGYAHQGEGENACKCFEQMKVNGISPDVVTFTCILKACGIIGAIDMGREIHDEIEDKGFLEKHVMLGNALVDMYTKCGDVRRAQEVFDELNIRDIVSWNTMISGYTQSAKSEETFNCLRQMRADGLSPDAFTFTCILKVCGSMGAIDKGTEIHDEIVAKGLLNKHIMLGNALIDMYAKCGDPEKAQELFNNLLNRDTVTWNALISGYAQQGWTWQALNAFKRMQLEGQFPDVVTFLSVLTSCSHSGLLNEGQMYYAKMMNTYGMSPSLEHQTCMVDLFGRVGFFDKAMEVIKSMDSPNYPVWCTLLGACQTWGNVKLGHVCFEQAIMIDNTSGAAYTCMVNIYASAGLHEDARNTERLRIQQRRRNLDMCVLNKQ